MGDVTNSKDTLVTRETAVKVQQVAPLSRRDKANADLLDSYTVHFSEKNAQNRSLKLWFFWFSVVLVFILVGALTAIAVIIVCQDDIDSASFGIAFSAIASALASAIGLPLVVGSYLFPKNEDESMLKHMLQMHKEDKEAARLDSSRAQSFIAGDIIIPRDEKR